MSFSVGIVGLPNVGKSTLFQLLTKRAVHIADYPFTTIDPNVGVVKVPDERLEAIAKIVKPEKITPTIIEFVDIAGLVKGAHKGEGLGNQFLAQIRNCDAILEVIKCFGDKVNPQIDIETIKMELEMKDQESKEQENFLSKKPIIYLLNVKGETQYQIPEVKHLVMNLKEGINGVDPVRSPITPLPSHLKEGEADLRLRSFSKDGLRKTSNGVDHLILACYNILDLITFYTVKGGKEARAWTLKKDLTTPQAGKVVHSDFQEKFIRAEVLNWEKLIEVGGWKNAREKGLIQTVSKEYLVHDGDVIEFKV